MLYLSSNERTEEELKRAKDNLDACTEIDTKGQKENHAQVCFSIPTLHFPFYLTLAEIYYEDIWTPCAQRD